MPGHRLNVAYQWRRKKLPHLDYYRSHGWDNQFGASGIDVGKSAIQQQSDAIDQNNRRFCLLIVLGISMALQLFPCQIKQCIQA
jgi:hypothetical protein